MQDKYRLVLEQETRGGWTPRENLPDFRGLHDYTQFRAAIEKVSSDPDAPPKELTFLRFVYNPVTEHIHINRSKQAGFGVNYYDQVKSSLTPGSPYDTKTFYHDVGQTPFTLLFHALLSEMKTAGHNRFYIKVSGIDDRGVSTEQRIREGLFERDGVKHPEYGRGYTLKKVPKWSFADLRSLLQNGRRAPKRLSGQATLARRAHPTKRGK